MQEAFGGDHHNVYWKPVLDELEQLKSQHPPGA
jgi:hypothetical protein